MQSVIKVENLGKSYLIGQQATSARYVALRDVIAHKVKNVVRKTCDAIRSHKVMHGGKVEKFWALRNVAFEVGQGEVVGIIGRNGAGKSTLLKVLSRITEPSEGRVTIRGRVASLLEVGTGFHPELTGRENIFLNGAILGMTKAEIRYKFDEIVAFAEVEKFIDTPVKHYSSGMYVRLAFAVAAHLEPEILVVDEVLAVGDASFQKKCLGKMQEISKKGGRTVLFVSHNMTAVRALCSRGILMSNGQAIYIGDTEVCIRKYMLSGEQIATEAKWDDLQDAPNNSQVWVKGIRAISCRTDGQNSSLFDMRTPIRIEVDVVTVKKTVFHVNLVFNSDQGVIAFTSGAFPPRDINNLTEAGSYCFTCHIPANLLNEGGYNVRLLIVEDDTRIGISVEDAIGFDVKDLALRGVGSWQGREPGVVRPHLEWRVIGKTKVSL